MEVTNTKLKNNLRLVTIDTHGAESATVLLLVGAGSRYETPANNGIAHFFEHMAFKGSQKYPNSLSIAQTIEGMGGVFNAFTSKDHTGYWIKGQAEKIPLMLDVLADMITGCKLEAAEIEKEKGVIVEEINMYEDMPQHKVSQVYDNLIFGGHPLGADIAGSHATVKSFTRETFVNYIKQYYYPENSILIISGGIGKHKEAISQALNDTFVSWKSASPDMAFTYPEFSKFKKGPELQIFNKKTEQAHFVLGYTVDYGFLSDQKHTLSLLGAILGGGMSSRLFNEVREKRGLCYYVHTGRDLYHETGSFVTSSGVRCDATTVNEAIRVIVAEHQKIANGENMEQLQKDLSLVKEMIKGRTLLSLEDSQSLAGFYGNKILLEGKIETPEEVIAKIQAITVEQIVAEAKRVFVRDNLKVALVGPFEEKEIII